MLHRIPGDERHSTEIPRQRVYYVVFAVTTFASFDDARTREPALIASHIARSKELHARGTLLLSGAFLDKEGEPLSTMGVLTTYEAAEEYIKGDPFVLHGHVSTWSIREWANIFA